MRRWKTGRHHEHVEVRRQCVSVVEAHRGAKDFEQSGPLNDGIGRSTVNGRYRCSEMNQRISATESRYSQAGNPHSHRGPIRVSVEAGNVGHERTHSP